MGIRTLVRLNYSLSADGDPLMWIEETFFDNILLVELIFSWAYIDNDIFFVLIFPEEHDICTCRFCTSQNSGYIRGYLIFSGLLFCFSYILRYVEWRVSYLCRLSKLLHQNIWRPHWENRSRAKRTKRPQSCGWRNSTRRRLTCLSPSHMSWWIDWRSTWM